MKTLTGWHFSGSRLRNGAPLPPKGTTLIHNGDIQMCSSGYHMSVLAIDALGYAPGPYVARVRLSGNICAAPDKAVGSRRTNLTAYVDCRPVLAELIRRWALRAVRVHAAHALHLARLTAHADMLAALPDDVDLQMAAAAAHDAAYAAAHDAAATAAPNAAYAADAVANAVANAVAYAANAAYAADAARNAARCAAANAYAAATAAPNAAADAHDAAYDKERRRQNRELTAALLQT